MTDRSAAGPPERKPYVVVPCFHLDVDDDWECCPICTEGVDPTPVPHEDVIGSDGFVWINYGQFHGIEDWVRVHDRQAETFIGPTPEGMEVYHLDGNVRNNRVDNLDYRPIGSGSEA